MVGTDVTGTLALSNNGDGIGIWNGAQYNLIGGTNSGAGNLLSGNASGISIYYGSSFTTIEGNLIGTDATGTHAIGNLYNGIYVAGYSNTIGGTAQGAGNLISGSHQDGVLLDGYDAFNDVVQGNRIGTDITGLVALGNALYGVGIQYGAQNNLIGGIAPGAGNLLSDNAYGVWIFNGYQNTLQGNLIGTDATGTGDLGNQQGGVMLSYYSWYNTIGGANAGAGNTIAFNHGNGVTIGSYSYDWCVYNAIVSNSIYANTGLGIDLGNDGVTPNTPGGYYYAPNQLQSYPILSPAVVAGTSTTLAGTLTSAPYTTYTIQFFSNPAADPSGYGQGQTYLGSTTVTTDASGNASFTLTIDIAVPTGQVVSATATDPNGNTSEFSQDVTVTSGSSALLAPGGPSMAGLQTKASSSLSVAAVDAVLSTTSQPDEAALSDLAFELARTGQARAKSGK